MKKLTVFCTAFFALSVSAELLAQTRGPRYNPPGGGSSSSSSPSRSSSSGSSSSSSSRGSSYSPPSRSSSSSSSSSGSSRGSSYSPPSRSSTSSSSSSGSSRGPSYNPPSSSSSSSSSSSGSSRGTNYNPPSSSSSSSSSSSGTTVTNPGPRYNPPQARYSPPRHQQAPGAVWVRRTVTHIPRTVVHRGPVRYTTPRDYHILVSRRYIYRRWVQEPVVFSYSNGYWDMDGYPYYVHRGYRYRYDPVDTCQYELVDGDDNVAVKTYDVQACSVAYDQCAVDRDTMNNTIGLERYFCAEAVGKEQEQSETEVFEPSAVPMTAAKKAEIDFYLAYRDYRDLFSDGRDTLGDCSIEKQGGLFSRGNQYSCKFVVKVKGKGFPLVDESICSDSESADAINCDVGNEKENAGCIFEKAVKAGYCH